MAERGRGKKENHNKNFVAAKDFAAGKRVGRPKQVFVPETEARMDGFKGGHWEKVKP